MWAYQRARKCLIIFTSGHTSSTNLGTYQHWLLVQQKQLTGARAHKAGSKPCSWLLPVLQTLFLTLTTFANLVPDSYQFCWLCYNTVSRMSKSTRWLCWESHPESWDSPPFLQPVIQGPLPCPPEASVHPPGLPANQSKGYIQKDAESWNRSRLHSWCVQGDSDCVGYKELAGSVAWRLQTQALPVQLAWARPLCLASELIPWPVQWGSFRCLSVLNQVIHIKSTSNNA